VRVVDGNGNATTTTYDIVDTNGLVDTTVTDALGHAVVKAQDAAGWTRSSADQLGFVTTQSFDADGNVLSVRDPNAVGQDCLYDSRNRRTQCTDTAGAVTQTGYDFNNNVTAMTDGLGHVTSMAFDARDRKVATTDRLGGVTRFAGHGTYIPGGATTTIPEGTTLTLPCTFGRGIGDDLGQLIENGNWDAIAANPKFSGPNGVMEGRGAQDSIMTAGASSYLPGAVIPELTLRAPGGLNIMSASTTVEIPTTTTQLLQSDMGNWTWASCVKIRGR